MKKLIEGSILFVSGLLIIAGCNDNSSSSTTVTDTSTLVKLEDSAKMGTQKINTGEVAAMQNDFVNKAAMGGMMEVELGRYAQANAGSQGVKDYGKMLETDHSEANQQLKSIAASKNISVPTDMGEEHNMHVKQMESMKGADFDKAYITMMVEDHVKDIEEFKKAAAENSDPDVRKFAADKLPTLQGHLAKAKLLKSKF
ncbi:MAG: DUF4142 domain-containing protein [Ferruginibacter sp.]